MLVFEILSCSEPCDDGSVEILDSNGFAEVLDSSGSGSGGRYGVVSVCVNGTRTALCDYTWDSLDAKVVCQQLGFSEYGLLHVPTVSCFGF